MKKMLKLLKMTFIILFMAMINPLKVMGSTAFEGRIATMVIPKAIVKYVDTDKMFYYKAISDELFQYIYGNSFKENCTTPREALAYVRVLYYGFDGETHIGELIVNKHIAHDVTEIFKELYHARYPIEKIALIDRYGADDELSMQDNNTSCFNFRYISGAKTISRHGLGLAIDINPLYNPYVKNNGKTVEPASGKTYADRSKNFPYKIDHNDLAYKVFTKYGFEWGGDWKGVKDYQHFEKDIEAIH